MESTIKKSNLWKAIFIFFIVFVGVMLVYNMGKNNNSRKINIYGLKKSITIDKAGPNQCFMISIQLRRDSFHVDTCFASFSEIENEFKENQVNPDWKFVLSKRDKVLQRHKSFKLEEDSIFDKLFLISKDQLRTMEEKMSKDGCDYQLALEVEILEGDKREFFQLSDTRTCNRIYAKFMEDLIVAFEEATRLK